MIRQKIESYDDIMAFGKFKGRTVGEVADLEPSYIIWLVDNKVIECDEDILEAAQMDDADNSPPEHWFMPDLGSK